MGKTSQTYPLYEDIKAIKASKAAAAAALHNKRNELLMAGNV